MTLLTAARRPAWASEITSLVPAGPRWRRLLRNSVQKAVASLSPTAKPRTSRCISQMSGKSNSGETFEPADFASNLSFAESHNMSRYT